MTDNKYLSIQKFNNVKVFNRVYNMCLKQHNNKKYSHKINTWNFLFLDIKSEALFIEPCSGISDSNFCSHALSSAIFSVIS